MIQIVTELLPSAHWQNATVIVLACGHRHVRPHGHAMLGAQFDCCFCDDDRLVSTNALPAHSTARGE